MTTILILNIVGSSLVILGMLGFLTWSIVRESAGSLTRLSSAHARPQPAVAYVRAQHGATVAFRA